MFTKKNAVVLIIQIFLLISQKSTAQNIAGKKIFIADGSLVTLRFASEIQKSRFNPSGASNSLAISMSRNEISFRPNQKNLDTITLFIEEGKNEKNLNRHSFILIYKDKLNFSELDYDYSTKEKIAAAIAAAQQEQENDKKEQLAKAQQAQQNSGSAMGDPPPQQEIHIPTPEEIDQRFSEIRTNANRAFSAKKYDDALALYKQALELKHNDPWCIGQIDVIKNIKTQTIENAKVNEQLRLKNMSYQNHIRVADSAFTNKAWDIARFEYNEALKDKAYDIHASSRIKEIDNLRVEESYKSYIDIGKQYLDAHEFDKAASAFQEALKIKQNDAEATKYLNSIKSSKDAYNRQLADLEKNKAIEKQYKDIIDYADNAFEAGNWEMARQKYMSALKIKKDDPHANSQIAKIDSIMRLKQEEFTQRTRDSIANANYLAAKKRGDDAFALKDYDRALKEYRLAHTLKPSENYPDAQISQIQIIQNKITADVQAEKERKKREDSINIQIRYLVSKADAARSKNDYSLAQTYILQALRLKSDDVGVQKKSNEINATLSEIEKNRKYEIFIAIGDSLINQAKNPDASLRWYDSAMALKPQESHAKNQYNFANYLILQRDSIKMEQEKSDALNRIFNEAMGDYKKGDAARIEKKYGEAYGFYAIFLDKIHTFSIEDYSKSQRVFITQALDYSKRLASYKIQSTDIGQLNTKYPNIDFTKPPPEQVFNKKRLDSSKQNAFIKTEIFSKSPRLNLMNSITDRTRVTCQSLTFKEQCIYLRFLIRNNDTSAFLTGPMLLNLAKKNETKQVLPLFISDFPVVLPGEEKQFVYVIPPMLLWNDETLVFEVSDRMKRKKTSININEAIFDMERRH